jgi:hypothetical protein
MLSTVDEAAHCRVTMSTVDGRHVFTWVGPTRITASYPLLFPTSHSNLVHLPPDAAFFLATCRQTTVAMDPSPLRLGVGLRRQRRRGPARRSRERRWTRATVAVFLSPFSQKLFSLSRRSLATSSSRTSSSPPSRWRSSRSRRRHGLPRRRRRWLAGSDAEPPEPRRVAAEAAERA